MMLSLTVNGEPHVIEAVGAGESLLAVLRDALRLTGTKNACEQGECGSCSVYLDGTLVCSCLVLAGQAAGRDVVTVEGLAASGQLDPVQEAFAEAGAVQCGFCTPGLVMAVHDLLRRAPDPADGQIREALAGNLCRCTGYQKIISAVHLAARTSGGAPPQAPGRPPCSVTSRASGTTHEEPRRRPGAGDQPPALRSGAPPARRPAREAGT